MSRTAVHDWLPPEVAQRAAVRERIEQAVADWSADWFAGRAFEVTAVRATARFRAGEDRRLQGAATAAAWSERAMRRLLDHALNVRTDPVTLTATDQKILDGFERRLVEDLLARLDTALGAAPRAGSAFGPRGGLEVALGDGQSSELLTLAVPLEAALPVARASLPRPRPAAPLDDLVHALAGADVVIDITLGQADLRLGDLRALAPGDVLVLDTPLTGAAQVALAGTGEVFAHAALTDLDGQMAVTFQA